jgi:hypothetical protein
MAISQTGKIGVIRGNLGSELAVLDLIEGCIHRQFGFTCDNSFDL